MQKFGTWLVGARCESGAHRAFGFFAGISRCSGGMWACWGAKWRGKCSPNFGTGLTGVRRRQGRVLGQKGWKTLKAHKSRSRGVKKSGAQSMQVGEKLWFFDFWNRKNKIFCKPSFWRKKMRKDAKNSLILGRIRRSRASAPRFVAPTNSRVKSQVGSDVMTLFSTLCWSCTSWFGAATGSTARVTPC